MPKGGISEVSNEPEETEEEATEEEAADEEAVGGEAVEGKPVPRVAVGAARGDRNKGVGNTTTSTLVPLSKDRESRECGSQDVYKGRPHR